MYLSFTDAIKNVTIPAIVCYINTLDSQSYERDKGKSTYLLIGDVSYKTINYYWANFKKNSNQMDFLEKLANFA